MNDTETVRETRRDWTQIGREFYGRGAATQSQIAAACDSIEWQELPRDGTALSMAFAPGEAIKALVARCHIPRVSHVGYSHELAPFGLIAVFGHYSNADVKVYAVDTGTEILPLAMDVQDK